MDTAELIFKILEEKGMEQKEFARLINVSEKIVSTWSTGRTKSYTKHLDKIAEVLGTTTDYLHTGKAPVIQLHIPEQHLDEELVAELTSATPDEITQVRAYLQGLKAGRKALVFPDK